MRSVAVESETGQPAEVFAQTGRGVLCLAAWPSALPGDVRRCPATVQNRWSGPVGPEIEREGAIRGGEPVAAHRLVVGRIVRDEKRQAAVGVALEAVVLRAERVTVELVRVEEVVFVVERERPETLDGRQPGRGERDRVAAGAVQAIAGRVEVLVEVGCLARRVDEDVCLAHGGTGEVVGPERCAVSLGRPVPSERDADVAELEQVRDQRLVRLDGTGAQQFGDVLSPAAAASMDSIQA